MMTREAALGLLQQYNKEPFHIRHGLTVEGVMRFFARELGYGEQEDFWGLVGLLHLSLIHICGKGPFVPDVRGGRGGAYRTVYLYPPPLYRPEL